MTTAKDLVDAIQSGKSATIQATFDSLMTEKIQNGIEAYRQAVIDNTFNPVDESESLDEVAYDSRTLDDKKKKQPVIARGVKGMKSTPFEKKFPSMAHYEKWADSEASGNHEVHDVRLHESTEEDLVEDADDQSIDELSKKTLGAYIKKSASKLELPGDTWDKSKRKAGIDRAADKLSKDESEEVSELSKKTLASYAKKASVANLAAQDRSRAHTAEMGKRVADGKLLAAADHAKAANKLNDKITKRVGGVNKAIDRLAKE